MLGTEKEKMGSISSMQNIQSILAMIQESMNKTQETIANNHEETKRKHDDLKSDVGEINDNIKKMDDKIEKIQQNIAKNEQRIQKTEIKMEQTVKKVEMLEQQQIASNRELEDSLTYLVATSEASKITGQKDELSQGFVGAVEELSLRLPQERRPQATQSSLRRCLIKCLTFPKQTNSGDVLSFFCSYTLITPGVLRTDTEEQILVEAHGDNTPKQLDIWVLDFPGKQRALFQTRVDMIVNPTGGMLVTPTIKIPARELSKDSRQNKYVVVQVTGPQVSLEKVVLLSYQSGFVFIQTDKGIYTPGSPVRYRVFSVDHNMHRMDKTVIVEFQTPQGIVVSSNPVDPNLIRPYNLPELASFGTWKAVAKYEHSTEGSYTAYFDVREYVLPSFEVRLQPSEKFLYIDGNTNFQVSITARYLYGKKVEGVAFVLFGVKIDGYKKSIPESLTRIPIIDGDGDATLERHKLRSRFQNLNDLVGHTLYASVTVITESGEQGWEKRRVNCFFEYKHITLLVGTHGVAVVVSAFPPLPFLAEKCPFSPLTGLPCGCSQSNPLCQLRAADSAVAQTSQGTAGSFLRVAPPPAFPPCLRTIFGHPAYRAAPIPVSAPMAAASGDAGSTEVQRLEESTVHGCYRAAPVPIVAPTAAALGDAGGTERARATPPSNPAAFLAVSLLSELFCPWLLRRSSSSGLDVPLLSSNANNSPALQHHRPRPGCHAAAAITTASSLVLATPELPAFPSAPGTSKRNPQGHPGSGGSSLGITAAAATTTALAAAASVKQGEKRRSQCSRAVSVQPRRSYTRAVFRSLLPSHEKYRDTYYFAIFENNYQVNCDLFNKLLLKNCTLYQLAFCFPGDFEDDFFGDDNIISRSDFPESWLWLTEVLPEQPNSQGISSKTLSFYLRDSITTWEVLAVSISPTKGICVAEPYEITAMKDFFIDLRVPYSVVKNEQVEIRAVLYNYADEDIEVLVELLHNPAFCSASTERQRYRQQLPIKALSSRAVPFVIVPLQQGLHDIEVKASVRGQELHDGVRKKLKVVPEGIRKDIVTIIELDPRAKGLGGTQEQLVKANKLNDKVPDTEIEIRISVQGDLVAQTVESSIDGSKLSHLIITPSGCGEQNMIRMTAPVIATYYLDTTEQWEALGINRRPEAVKQIMTGYAQQMVYKKADHSYAAFTDRASSTWLTAYVVKVFALAAKIVKDISHEIICGGVRWLILNRQQPDGVFKENAPVLSGTMQGGLKGAEPDVCLTAFVLVALLESRSICNEYINSLDSSINKSANYLLKRYEKLQKPYTTALTAYALAAADSLDDSRVLMAASTGRNRWEEHNAHTHNIEGTSYALLALLKMKKFDEAGPVVKWLIEQKYYGGTYGQTQATVVGFQALAEYEIQMSTHKNLNLDIVIRLPERKIPINYRLDATNAARAQTTEVQ
ncbi:venom factor-like [Pantherophis guttatus]|uniref:Venom factor-like n=1 Tax=Pantherophis guttatus TaxID=94885 RepID=A0ABM3YTL7_PANGU|nr:venom factor-like [Pantherophis guttatus]